MIEKIFLFGLVCCLVLQAKAQTFNNTIVNDNSSWATLNVGSCPDCPVWTQYVYFDGDSVVADYSYKKVFSYNDEFHENIRYEGLIREQDKKTYFISAYSEVECLLYDFLLEEGMSFEYWNCWMPLSVSLYVKNVDFIEINGSMKKRIQMTMGPNAEQIIETWVEGIGSLNGILNPCYWYFWIGGFRNLLCYHQNNELVYQNPAYSECYYEKIEDITSVQTITINSCNVFLNTVNNVLNISCMNNAISRIEIFDSSGRLIYSQAHKDTVNISPFSKGLYLIRVYNTSGQVSVFKVIKK